jgi:hypothetical protein
MISVYRCSLQVGALGGSAGDHVWVAVEDGRIAPPGTHLIGAVFKWMYPSLSLSVDRPSAAKSGRSRDNVTDSTLGGGRDVSKKRKSASSKAPPKAKSSKVSKEPMRVPSIVSEETGDKSEAETKTEMETESIERPSATPLEKTNRLLPLTLCAVLKEKDREKDKMDPMEKNITLWNLLKECRLAGVSAPPPSPPLEDLDIFLASKAEYCVFDKEKDVHSLPADTSSSLSPQTNVPVLSSSDLLSTADSKSPPRTTAAASTLTMVVSAADLDLIHALSKNPTQSIEPCHVATGSVVESPMTTTTPSLSLSMESFDDEALATDSALDEVPLPLPLLLPLPVSASIGVSFTPLPPLPLRCAQQTHQAADLDSPEGSETNSSVRRDRDPSPRLSRCLVSRDDLHSKRFEGPTSASAPPAESILAVCHATSWTRPSCCINSNGSKTASSGLILQSANADTNTDAVRDTPSVSALCMSDPTTLRVNTCVSADDVVSPYVTPSHDDAAEDAASDAATSADCSSQGESSGASNDCSGRDTNLATFQIQEPTRNYWLDDERISKCLGASSWLVRDSCAEYGLSEGRSPGWIRSPSPSSCDSPQENVMTKSRRRSRERNRDRQSDDTSTDHSRSRSEEAESCTLQTDLQSISDEEGVGVQGCLPDRLDNRARGARKRGRGRHLVRGASTDEGSARDDVSSETGTSVDREVESARWKSADEALGRERERKRWRSKEEVVSAMIEAVKRKRRGEGGPD